MRVLTSVLDLAGLSALTAGAAVVWGLGAALVVGGVCLLAASWALTRRVATR